MMPLTQVERIDPAHQIAARLEDARDLKANGVDIIIEHRRQSSAPPLPSALVAEFQVVEHCAVLWVEKYQWRVCLWQQAQQRERIAVLYNVHYGRAIEHDASPS
jgi:hypothetical protein